MHQLHYFRDKKAVASVFNALVTSRLDYCNALYAGLPFENTLDTTDGAECNGLSVD